MTFILPSFGASAISAVPASGGGGGSAIQNDFSLSFDGTNSWLDIGDISSLTGSQANLSLSYWVKETSILHTKVIWVRGKYTRSNYILQVIGIFQVEDRI